MGGELDVQGAGERRVCVCDELDEIRSGKALILLPRCHHGPVIDTGDVDLIDPCLLKTTVNFSCLEARDLALGSRGGESPGEGHPENFLALDKLSSVLLGLWVQAVESDVNLD